MLKNIVFCIEKQCNLWHFTSQFGAESCVFCIKLRRTMVHIVRRNV